MASERVLRYIELKTGFAGNGPAWIARVKLSRSGRALYHGHKLLKRAHGGGIAGNYFDADSGDEYWVSGVKKDGRDRHSTGSGKVAIEVGAVSEYLKAVGRTQLNKSQFEVVPDLEPPDMERTHVRENASLEERTRPPNNEYLDSSSQVIIAEAVRFCVRSRGWRRSRVSETGRTADVSPASFVGAPGSSGP